jgi:hypothetical protein
MYELAVPYFPENEKLLKKISDLKEKDRKPAAKTRAMSPEVSSSGHHQRTYSSLRQELFVTEETFAPVLPRPKPKRTFAVFSDNTKPDDKPDGNDFDYVDDGDYDDYEDDDDDDGAWCPPSVQQTPRTQALLKIINSEDVAQIMKLKV